MCKQPISKKITFDLYTVAWRAGRVEKTVVKVSEVAESRTAAWMLFQIATAETAKE